MASRGSSGGSGPSQRASSLHHQRRSIWNRSCRYHQAVTTSSRCAMKKTYSEQQAWHGPLLYAPRRQGCCGALNTPETLTILIVST
eukprot:5755294-Pyramimonas_sp.AAC.2